MNNNNHEAMIKETYEALRKIFLEGDKNGNLDMELLNALATKIALRSDFVLGAFIAWDRPSDDAPTGIPLDNGEVLFFGEVLDSFKDIAKNTSQIIQNDKLFISGLLHKKKDIRSKQVNILYSGETNCNLVSNSWYSINQLNTLESIFTDNSDKVIAERYKKVVKGYFPNCDSNYFVIYCPFLVPDGKPPGNYFGVYSTNGSLDLLDHLVAIQHAGTMVYARRAMESKKEEILEHGRLSSVAAIMARNMSHNIGSHVLSQISNAAMKNGKDLMSLHAYLQRRMDLVARITSRSPDWGEPLWFFGDLMRGFLSQTILLDTLVRDQGGWGKNAKKIRFILHKDHKQITFTPCDTGWLTEDVYFDDFLVSIPDSSIGAQAFYVFLESLMRNSAKYGKSKDLAHTFDIHLEITEGLNGEGYYEIGIWDSLSTCPNDDENALCDLLQKKIKDPLTDEMGELSAKSLGIAEMKEACKFLISPFGENYPVRPLDKFGNRIGCEKCASQNGQKVRSDNNIDTKANGGGLKKTVEKGTLPLWVECYKPNTENDKFLRYKLHLSKPRLVGIYESDNNEIVVPSDAKKLGIVKLSCKEEFEGAEGAFQFAVILVNDNMRKEICEWISQKHRYLPQRLLLVANNQSNEESVIPDGRVVWCDKKDIFGQSGDNVDSERLIVNVYEAWIKKKWLKSGEPVNIHVSYERENAPNQWKCLNDIQGLEFAGIVVWCFKGSWVKAHCKGINDTNGLTLHYSNHGTTHSGLPTQNVVQFKNGDLTCELLFAPPSSTFGISYFLLGLIEAALMKVTIVDERVALWVVEPGPDLANKRMDDAKQSNVFIVFKYNEIVFLTKALEDYSTIKKQTENPFKRNVIVEIDVYKQDFFTRLNSYFVDLVVLHVGVAETADNVKLFNASTTVEEASKIAPAVVMMSGRGGLKERKAGHMPFIEYSAVRQCFSSHTGNISKYHLVKSLMSAKSNS